MKKALVTGVTGFVGSHTAFSLLDAGYEVHVLVRPASDTSKFGTLKGKVVMHTGDLTNRDETFAAVAAAAPDHVFHLATSPLMSGKTADAKTLLAVNVEGTVNLMDAAAKSGVTAFINVASFSEYGPKDHPVAEDERCDPVELYAVTKLAATLYGQGLARRGILPCISFRLFTPYGPGIQKGRLVRTVLEKIQGGGVIPLAKPTIARDFVYAEDVPPLLIEAAEKASTHAGEIFNLGTGVRTTLEELVNVSEKVLGKKASPEWNAFPVQSYDSELWQADMEKTFSAFSWRPKVELSEGIRKTAESLGFE